MILHSMSDSKLGRLFWSIHVATETHGNFFYIIASLNSNIYKAADPVIEGSSVLFFNLCGCMFFLGIWIVGIPFLFYWVPYNCEEKLFLMVVFQPPPPPSVIHITLRLCVSGGISKDRYV